MHAPAAHSGAGRDSVDCVVADSIAIRSLSKISLRRRPLPRTAGRRMRFPDATLRHVLVFGKGGGSERPVGHGALLRFGNAALRFRNLRGRGRLAFGNRGDGDLGSESH
jgi:hypothetical protein